MANRRRFVKTVVGGTFVGLAGCAGEDAPEPADDDDDVADDTDPADVERPPPEDDVDYESLGTLSWLSQSREDAPQRYEEGQFYQTYVEDLGFEYEEDVMELGAWVDTLFERDWDFAHLGWSDTVERVFPYYNLFFSFHSQFAEIGEGNFQMFRSDEYDDVIESFSQEMDLDARIEYAYQAQEIIGKNQPVIFTVHPPSLVAHNDAQFTDWELMVGEYAYWNRYSLMTADRGQGDDTMIFGTVAPPEDYPNFMSHTGPAAQFLHRINYDPLVQVGPDGEVIPEAAAESWDVVDDTTIEFELREGMTFHDGEPVTAEDVVFTWDFATGHGVPYIAADIAAYESAEAVDDTFVRFNLAEPFSAFIPVACYRLPILPQHVWDGVTEREDLGHPGEWPDPDTTGSGPFELVQYDPGDRIVFHKHEDHYNADRYEFDQLIWDIYGTSTAVLGDLEPGTVDFTQGLGPTDWQRADDMEEVVATDNPAIAANGIWVQNDQEPFNDVLVRQALAYAMDREEVLATVYDGLGLEARSPITPGNDVYFNDGTPTYDHDLERAIELLTESGFRWDEESGEILKPVDWEPSVEYVGLDD